LKESGAVLGRLEVSSLVGRVGAPASQLLNVIGNARNHCEVNIQIVCPACDRSLETGIVAGVRVLECPGHHGFGFWIQELLALKRRLGFDRLFLDQDMNWQVLLSLSRCPSCGAMEYGHGSVEEFSASWCHACGSFFLRFWTEDALEPWAAYLRRRRRVETLGSVIDGTIVELAFLILEIGRLEAEPDLRHP
jgi:hypothetical protein